MDGRYLRMLYRKVNIDDCFWESFFNLFPEKHEQNSKLKGFSLIVPKAKISFAVSLGFNEIDLLNESHLHKVRAELFATKENGGLMLENYEDWQYYTRGLLCTIEDLDSMQRGVFREHILFPFPVPEYAHTLAPFTLHLSRHHNIDVKTLQRMHRHSENHQTLMFIRESEPFTDNPMDLICLLKNDTLSQIIPGIIHIKCLTDKIGKIRVEVLGESEPY